jgi:hydrogenase maturation protein HypF
MPNYAVRVRGQVQGVGFRPFVWQLATRLGLSGDVANDAEGVLIRIAADDLEPFLAALRTGAPPLSRIDAIEVGPHDGPLADGFVIARSGRSGAETRVTPVAATCADCLAEIRDRSDRRFDYAFANCTNCGPRFSILRSLPYDRAQTTMAAFAMCDRCRAEYENPADRRFHAQPVACPACGPNIWPETPAGEALPDEGIATAAMWIAGGGIVAVKGLGGFHLACDATNAEAVARLRSRKRRPGKPFALMAPLAIVERHATLTDADRALLRDPAAPVVLLPSTGTPLPEGLAPGLTTLGWMLPYTPLHHLLCDALRRPLVMTSGNLSGEPQVIGNDEAREKLAPFVDGFLMHDRDIARRLDDSVERMTPRGPMVLRRARGRVPGTLPLPPGFEDAPQAVAFGGQLKSAICLAKNGQALLSQHLGDLDEALTWDEFRKADRDYAELFDHRPEVFACDLHPDFRATRHAEARAGDAPIVHVQHHHAHLAACLGENLWARDGGPVAGVVLDGLGLGPDGTVWGGEVLVGDYAGVERRAWLRPAPLVGGDAAQRDPWRNALVRLDGAGLSDVADRFLADHPLSLARQAAAAGINAPLSSSAGRLFDAVAGILGIATAGQSYEGEAAMRLEALAEGASGAAPYPMDGGPGEIDPAPMIRAIVRDMAGQVPGQEIASRFHAGLARAFCRVARDLVNRGEARAVALTGGCFQNATLLRMCFAELDGLPVLIHTRTPANDGGLALGQVLVALATRLESR